MQVDRIYSWGASHMESAFKGYILAGRGQVENTSAEWKSFTVSDKDLCQACTQTINPDQVTVFEV